MELIVDPQRPQYHFMPPANWMNDPNGLIQWQGQYHLFYQYYPEPLPQKGFMYWGHAVSRDLTHWEHLPIALAPTPGTPDEGGCWSGCAINDNGVPTFIYTGFLEGIQKPCLARGSADLITWEKWPGNPIIAEPPAGIDKTNFRDHSAWKEGDTWYQAIGAGIKGGVGRVLLYRSTDLLNWDYLHPLYTADEDPTKPFGAGSMCECPDFFALDQKHVLCISLWAKDASYPSYITGQYSEQEFTTQYSNKLDFGLSFYAPQSFLDDQGRRIMFGWLRERRSDDAQRAAGWSGVMSLPRVLTLRDDNSLRVEPAIELQALRGVHQTWPAMDLPETLDLQTGGDSLEILAEFAPGEAAELGIEVRCSPDGVEKTRISYNCAAGILEIDGSQASLSEDVKRDIFRAALEPDSTGTLKLHIFVDHSVVEVFANERTCITSRVYPTRSDSLGVNLFSVGAGARLVSLDVWTMN